MMEGSAMTKRKFNIGPLEQQLAEMHKALQQKLTEAEENSRNTFADYYYQSTLQQYLKALPLLNPSWINGFSLIHDLKQGKQLQKELSQVSPTFVPLIFIPNASLTHPELEINTRLLSLTQYLYDETEKFSHQYQNIRLLNLDIDERVEKFKEKLKRSLVLLEQNQAILDRYQENLNLLNLYKAQLESDSNECTPIHLITHIESALKFLKSEQYQTHYQLLARAPIALEKLNNKKKMKRKYAFLKTKLHDYYKDKDQDQAEAIFQLFIETPLHKKYDTQAELSALLNALAIAIAHPSLEKNTAKTASLQLELKSIAKKHSTQYQKPDLRPWFPKIKSADESSNATLDEWVMHFLENTTQLLVDMLHWHAEDRYQGIMITKNIWPHLSKLAIVSCPTLSSKQKTELTIQAIQQITQIIKETKLTSENLISRINRTEDHLKLDEHTQLSQAVGQYTASATPSLPAAQDDLSQFIQNISNKTLIMLTYTTIHANTEYEQKRMNSALKRISGYLLSLNWGLVESISKRKRILHVRSIIELLHLDLMRLIGMTLSHESEAKAHQAEQQALAFQHIQTISDLAQFDHNFPLPPEPQPITMPQIIEPQPQEFTTKKSRRFGGFFKALRRNPKKTLSISEKTETTLAIPEKKSFRKRIWKSAKKKFGVGGNARSAEQLFQPLAIESAKEADLEDSTPKAES
jgi:hypothetical protein